MNAERPGARELALKYVLPILLALGAVGPMAPIAAETTTALPSALPILQPGWPRLVPDSRVTDGAGSADALDAEEFARLALVASGADDATVGALLLRLDARAGELASSLPAGADARAKGEAILPFMYRSIISKYSLYQTRLDVALQSGEYNCVSSAILYAYFAKRLGLDVAGVETPDHSFCTVAIDGARVDVETTNPYGFDPGSKKDLPAENENIKKYVVVPQTQYRNRKPISDRRLVALIYNNRVSRLEKAGKYDEAVPLGIDAWKLQGDAASAAGRNERFMNYAVGLVKRGKSAEAVDFILYVTEAFGDDARYAELVTGAMGESLNAMMKAKDFASAFEFLSAYREKVRFASFAELEKTVTVNYLQYIAETRPFPEAIAALDSALGSPGALGGAEYERIFAYAHYREADRISTASGWLEAVALLDKGLSAFPKNADMARQRSVYVQNYASDVHNEAARAWNAGDKDRAKAIVRSGLEKVPGNTLLSNDLKRFK